jgi:hypothetical protein
MLKLTILLFFVLPFTTIVQQNKLDSLCTVLQNSTSDGARNKASVNLYFFFRKQTGTLLFLGRKSFGTRKKKQNSVSGSSSTKQQSISIQCFW